MQIGANDGITHDPIHRTLIDTTNYCIFIEPVRVYFQKLIINYANRKNSVFLNVAVSDRTSVLQIRFVNPHHAGIGNVPIWASGIGTLEDNVNGIDGVATPADEFAAIRRVTSSELVSVVDIRSLLSASLIPNLRFLVIDAEGSDFKIITSINWLKTELSACLFECALMSKIEIHTINKTIESTGRFNVVFSKEYGMIERSR